MHKFSRRSLEVLNKINPVLSEIMCDAIDLSPIDFGIPSDGGLRTAERQYELFLAEKSKCDGYKIKSNHQTGNAVDVFAYVNGRASWSDVHLSIIAGVVLSVANRKGVKLRWGGTFGSDNFNGWDMPHFEIAE
jgi:peptidoglycan L-alanyl-D-glutamate endopeptidase CwlK